MRLLLALLLAVPAAGGEFVRVGDLAVERWAHTATLLRDGRVLIAGGESNSGTARSAELYDPSTRTFSETGSMLAARKGHSATLLPSGLVLIAGGIGLKTAELYDPSTGRFSETRGMLEERFFHGAVLLPNGKVLMAGGGGQYFPARAELYDPETGAFSDGGAYAAPPIWPTATLLKDGRVFAAGSNPAQIYDPSSDSFTVSASMLHPQYAYGFFWHTATLLLDGTVLIAGGNDDWSCGGINNAEIFDPRSGTQSPAGLMTTGRDLHTATRLANGLVLLTGGGSGGCGYPILDSVELYDPASRSFIAAGRMSSRRADHTATLLRDGSVLITGGVSQWGIPTRLLKTAEVYVPYPRVIRSK